jgi:hypothetical protein
MQATLTTGKSPSEHGIVANGVATYRRAVDAGLVDPSSFASFRRDVSFWEQSNQFLEAPRFWQGTGIKTALLFFQQSMDGFGGKLAPAADLVITPKPVHGADGKLTSVCWSRPGELATTLTEMMGSFPLMNYWGARAGLAASQWIEGAGRVVWVDWLPQLQWVYLPHLDYELQRHGPESDEALQAVMDVSPLIEGLIGFAEGGEGEGSAVLLSEYAMQPVNRSIAINAVLRRAGLLSLRETGVGKIVDYERSGAFAMVDHQVGHVYLRDLGLRKMVARLMVEAGAEVLEPRPIVHVRGGDLQIQSPGDAWFDYRWWDDAADAPGFARTVDIHRKPGYDPLELFWDAAAGGIAQDAKLVRGSHGRVDGEGGIFVCDGADVGETIEAVDVAGVIRRLLQD